MTQNDVLAYIYLFGLLMTFILGHYSVWQAVQINKDFCADYPDVALIPNSAALRAHGCSSIIAVIWPLVFLSELIQLIIHYSDPRN